ncbi:uncharacterized calcium-binding protein At1g02270-like isoform X3 [Macadamia integrifolia]|uniref:uncharacterized calcium-binding protein At1g02270-like isoform X3 n=1 Tax=Macadamia integrifolia TaxID=60698 RepID=UPI001C52AC54|nr:uncharacterized calcium-binding protein At1g02270-like isoform X3 [Macadamia integrifolia]
MEAAIKVSGGGGTTESMDVLDQYSNSIEDVSCTTFNILAPIYKRLNGLNCESEFREYWLSRNEKILEGLLHRKSSIICIQSLWECMSGDSVMMVMQLISLQGQTTVVMVYKILQYIESYCEEYQLPHVPIILCGDWNGSKRGHVYKFLCTQGFVSSYDIAHHCTDSDEDACKWVSHRNHRGNICGVDFIWLCNPNNHRMPLKESFMKAVLGNIKNHLHDHGSYITYSQFLQTFSQLGLTSHPFNVLSTEEVKDLWDHVDTNGDGVIEYSLLNSEWKSQALSQQKENSDESKQRGTKGTVSNTSTTIGFKIKNAVLFPPEVEKGLWPENYSLSDHAHLTVEFSPVTIQCC